MTAPAEGEKLKGPYKEIEGGAIIGPTKVLQIALVVCLLNEAFAAGEKKERERQIAFQTHMDKKENAAHQVDGVDWPEMEK